MGNNFDFMPDPSYAAAGKGFGWGDLLGSAVGPTILGLGNYFLGNQANQDKIDAQNRQNEFTNQQDLQNFQQSVELQKLQAALSDPAAAAKAAVKVAKIKAQVDREKMLQEAYIASMNDALQSGQIIGNQLGGVAQGINQLRFR